MIYEAMTPHCGKVSGSGPGCKSGCRVISSLNEMNIEL